MENDLYLNIFMTSFWLFFDLKNSGLDLKNFYVE